jgi:4-hydroxybenzoate polyprenyltransferase
VGDRHRPIPLLLLSAVRPRQWAKNLLLFSGLVFGQQFGDIRMVLLSVAGFAVFCALAGAVYLLNDVRDRERDAAHPEKRSRPIASGELAPGTAVAAAVILFAVAIVAGFLLGPLFGLVCIAYLLLQTLYTTALKDVVLLDVFLIATGFVLRALAGAVVLAVRFSPWLFLCTMMLALFLGFGKRKHELMALGADVDSHRPALRLYSPALLDQAVGLSATAAVLSYSLYALTSTTGRENPYLMFTIPFVLYGVLRYLYHLYTNREGGSPEKLLYADVHMYVTVLLWIATTILAMILRGVGSP